MNKKELNKFFEKNTPQGDIPSAQAFAHFTVGLFSKVKDTEALSGVMNELLAGQTARNADISEEKSEIESATCEQLIKIMRRGIDPMSQDCFLEKALSCEKDLVPEVVKMFKTSGNGDFIECVTRLLVACTIDIADDIVGYFDDMRTPYAQSMALIVLGFKGDENLIPWLIEKYDLLKKHYPSESYYEGAYYALIEIDNRF